MKYLLTSTSSLKFEALQDVLKQRDVAADITTVSCNEGLPSQPYKDGVIFAVERMMRERRSNLKSFQEYDFVISIENYIQESHSRKDAVVRVSDYVSVVIYCGCSGNIYYSSERSCDALDIYFSVYDNWCEGDLQTYDDIMSMAVGYEKTFGEYLAETFPEENIDPKHWHVRYGVDRRDSMRNVLHKTFHKISESKNQTKLRSVLSTYVDFPIPGINYIDVNPILNCSNHYQLLLTMLGDRYERIGIDYVIGLESRGLILAGALATLIGAGVLMVRKKGKLPGKTVTESYAKEYGVDEFEMADRDYTTGIQRAQPRCVILDDIIVTGGSMGAAVRLARQCGLQVEDCCAIGKIGDKRIQDYPFPLTVLLEDNQ